MAERAPHRIGLRVYWEDTDAAGIVYYANYLRFAERGRTELLRALGVGQRRMAEEQGIAFAVRRCACDYLRPARLDDSLVVETSVSRAAGATIEMRQDILRGEELLARLDVTVACLGAGGRPARLPPTVRHALAAFVAEPS
ncbi:MAG: tol-pal system-associated acyl-CoA thioesterase [Alphaproteobacteria bacterium]